MTKTTKFSLLAFFAVLALVMAVGATAVFAQSDGDDPMPDDETTTEDPTTSDEPSEDDLDQRGFHQGRALPGHFGLAEGLSSGNELLADALGIDVETLDQARQDARVAAIEQALEEELITEEQAEMLLNGEYAFGFHHGHGPGGFGGSIDEKALLADALEISVEELETAEQQAREVALAEMVEAGYLTEEEASLMAAQNALKAAIDRDALLAEILGVSQAELEEARADREAVAALIEASGMTNAELQEAMQAAYEAAVEQAVNDGVITADQYAALQEAGLDSPGPGGHGFGGHGHGGGHGRHGGFGAEGFSGRFSQPPSTSTSPTANSI
jgi:hypothetical protein